LAQAIFWLKAHTVKAFQLPDSTETSLVKQQPSMMMAARTLVAALVASAQAKDCADGESCALPELSLLQKQIALAPDSAEESLPTLTLLGRSFYSSDPEASAKFMERYFSGEVVGNKANLATVPGAVTAGAFLKSRTDAGDYTMLFAKGKNQDAVMDKYAKTAELDFNVQTSPKVQGWSYLGYFHDGLADYCFNLSNAAADQLKFFHHGSVTRNYLTGTAYTFELKMAFAEDADLESGVDYGFAVESASDMEYLTNHTWELDEPCRMSMEEEAQHAEESGGANNDLWWKSTYSVANAYKAMKFAEDVLGATKGFCPFPYPPTDECTGALWLEVAPEGDKTFKMHFVEMFHEYDKKFHEYHAEQAKALSKGCMQASLYDNLAMSVATLDPFVRRLQKSDTPFLAMKVGDRYALIFAFPGNEAVVMQLQSDVLTAVEAMDQEAVAKACDSL